MPLTATETAAGRELKRLGLEQPVRIAGKTAHRAKRHMADHAGDTEIGIVDEVAGQLLVAGEVGTYDAGDVIDRAADFPALDHGIDGGHVLFETAAVGL